MLVFTELFPLWLKAFSQVINVRIPYPNTDYERKQIPGQQNSYTGGCCPVGAGMWTWMDWMLPPAGGRGKHARPPRKAVTRCHPSMLLTDPGGLKVGLNKATLRYQVLQSYCEASWCQDRETDWNCGRFGTDAAGGAWPQCTCLSRGNVQVSACTPIIRVISPRRFALCLPALR